MIGRQVSGIAVIASVIGLLVPLTGMAPEAQAGWSSCDWRPSHRHARGFRRHRSPMVFHIGASPHRHVFYHVVTEPLVPVIALEDWEEHQIVVVDGVTFHYYDGKYYRGAPVTQIPPAPSAAPAASTTLVINVPNANGSYTPVRLHVGQDGTYIGPNGEVYPTQPDIKQLAAMYAK